MTSALQLGRQPDSASADDDVARVEVAGLAEQALDELGAAGERVERSR